MGVVMRRFLILALWLAGCGESLTPAVEDVPPLLDRCPSDGLCVVRDSHRVLSVGYREGDRQIAYDAIKGHVEPLARATGARDICQRVVWGASHLAWHEIGSGCPKEWAPPATRVDDTETFGYGELMPRMAAAMAATSVSEPWRDSWEHMIREMAKWQDAPRRWAAQDSEPMPSYSAPPPGPGADTVLYGFIGSDGSSGGLGGLSGSSTSSSTVTEEHGRDTPPVPELRRVYGPYMYRQEIEVWAQPVRNLLLMGDVTNAQHSGTVTHVYRSPMPPAPARWELADSVIARNHGAEPGFGSMRIVADCRDMPLTFDFYVTGGCMEESSGIWPFHLCNDDSALQVLHARGADVFGEPYWAKSMTRTMGPGRWTSDMPSDNPRREKRLRAPDCHPKLRWQLSQWD